MNFNTILAVVFTVIGSVSVVTVLILLGWFLIWKAFLSKFRLVRELLGQENGDEAQPIEQQPHIRAKKIRRD
ncbi:PREDICTED: small integral membrane protein 13 [Bactrocera latifrons]|uniref:Small integral membrane protein 13 n=1 Tax=Bactrocera dorsalis TaxID=27457 RepID=A0A6J0RG88_BACDO|nr:PREDICTED: small integral membrane protein 13 [Bactrocera latifrons]XP_019845182.1 small integral membrane protein 13 [Bactrocera dorsalis]XP_049317902.1 small integral membrane protein 13 [Bactrocera dorsalis]